MSDEDGGTKDMGRCSMWHFKAFMLRGDTILLFCLSRMPSAGTFTRRYIRNNSKFFHTRVGVLNN